VLERKELKKIREPKRDQVTWEWRRLRNKELNDLLFLTKRYSGDQIKKNEMGGAHSMYGEERRGTYNVLVEETSGKETPLQDLGVDLRIIVKCISKNSDGGKEWINLAKDRDSGGLL
jgi:hypothetical protein